MTRRRPGAAHRRRNSSWVVIVRLVTTSARSTMSVTGAARAARQPASRLSVHRSTVLGCRGAQTRDARPGEWAWRAWMTYDQKIPGALSCSSRVNHAPGPDSAAVRAQCAARVFFRVPAEPTTVTTLEVLAAFSCSVRRARTTVTAGCGGMRNFAGMSGPWAGPAPLPADAVVG